MTPGFFVCWLRFVGFVKLSSGLIAFVSIFHAGLLGFIFYFSCLLHLSVARAAYLFIDYTIYLIALSFVHSHIVGSQQEQVSFFLLVSVWPFRFVFLLISQADNSYYTI